MGRLCGIAVRETNLSISEECSGGDKRLRRDPDARPVGTDRATTIHALNLRSNVRTVADRRCAPGCGCSEDIAALRAAGEGVADQTSLRGTSAGQRRASRGGATKGGIVPAKPAVG